MTLIKSYRKESVIKQVFYNGKFNFINHNNKSTRERKNFSKKNKKINKQYNETTSNPNNIVDT